MRELVNQIRAFTKGRNEAAKPFVWAGCHGPVHP